MKAIIFTLLMIIPVLSKAQLTHCSIKGMVDNKNISYVTLHIGDTMDTAFVEHGMFAFSVTLVDPEFAALYLNYLDESQKRDLVPVFLQEGALSLIISTSNGVIRVNVTGPVLSVDYEYKLWEPVKQLNVDIQNLNAVYYKEKTDDKPDTTTIHAQLLSKIRECFKIPKDYIRQHPDSQLSLQALTMLGSGDPTSQNGKEELAALFATLSEDVKNSEPGKKYRRTLNRLLYPD